MKADEKTAECEHDFHQYCSGPKAVRRAGAPAWEPPLMTIRCGCDCHAKDGAASYPSAAP